MKLFAIVLVFISFSFTGSAVNTIRHTPLHTQLDKITVGQFISIDIDKLQEAKFIHLNWLQKSLIKSTQRKLERKVSKGKIDASKKLFAKEGASGNNKRGMWATILGGAGLLFLGLGPLWVLSLPLGIVGLILGIKGVKKDDKDTLGIIGIVLSSLVILFFLLLGVAIGALASL